MATYQLTQTGAQVQADLDAVEAGDIVYLTSAPSADNTSGKLKIVVLEEEPSTRYDGYIYIIKGNTSITDLTGTKWYFNSPLSIGGKSDSDATYKLNFKSNNTEFSVLRYSAMAYRIFYRIDSSDSPGTNVYTGSPGSGPHDPSTTGTWANEAYRTIEITGGTDATNADLISWLQANATQVSANQANLISFTFRGTTYQAESGMTWADFISSQYNTGNAFSIQDNRIISSTKYIVNDHNGISVTPSDRIIANEAYLGQYNYEK